MDSVAVLATALPIPPGEQRGPINGARVATGEALAAILRHGSADRYDLLYVDQPGNSPDAYWSALAALSLPLERARLVPLPRLRETLSTTSYLAVHDPGSCLLGRLAALVHPLVPTPTPCTAVSHSISYGNLLPAFLETCLAGVRPFDALFCSSRACQAAMKHLLDHVCNLPGIPTGGWQHQLPLIPLGIDVATYAPALLPSAARSQLGLPPDDRYVAYVGRLSPFDKADLDVLLRAFATLRREPTGNTLRLLLTGDDSQRYSAYLAARAQQLGVGASVHLLTDVPEHTKRLVLWSADVFVSPADSVQESFGLAVVEAMAAGRPVVVSDWSGYRDIVEDGVTGFLIPTTWGPVTSAVDAQAELGSFMSDHLLLGQGVVVDEDALADRLRRLLQDDGLRMAMGERARQAAARYDWSVIVARYHETWRALKAEAFRHTGEHRPPLRLPYWQVFGHYATHAVSPDDLVERRQAAPLPPPPLPLQLLVHEETVKRQLESVSAGPRAVRELVATENELLALLWLAKGGAVRITSTVAPDEKDAGH